MTPVLHGPVLAALQDWLPADDEEDRPRVQLATVDQDGLPDVRTVLLTAWDAHGLVVHTDARSRKAAQLAARPHAALLVLWPGFTRQLVVRGPVAPQDPAAAARAYARRSPYLRQLAWQNTAETAALPRERRVEAWARFPPDAADLPPTSWAGFVLQPDRVTFWESDAEGPSHRVEHRRDAGAWTVQHLPG